MKTWILLFCVIILPASSAMPIQASSSKVRFTGMVKAPNGNPIENATIMAINGKLKKKLKSDEQGKFAVELPGGIYTFIVEKTDCSKLIIKLQIGSGYVPDFGFTKYDFELIPQTVFYQKN